MACVNIAGISSRALVASSFFSSVSTASPLFALQRCAASASPAPSGLSSSHDSGTSSLNQQLFDGLSRWLLDSASTASLHLWPLPSSPSASPCDIDSGLSSPAPAAGEAVSSISASLLDVLPDFGILFAVPKNKPSKQRGKTRRVGKMLNRGIPLRRYKKCTNCGQPILLGHICYSCFLNHKQLSRVVGWRTKSVFPCKDKVPVKNIEDDKREWTAPQGVPDNRSWIAVQSEKLYKRERAGETKRKKKHPSDMRREILRGREARERESRWQDVNQQLWDDIIEAEEERASYEKSIKDFDELWAKRRKEKREELDRQMQLDYQQQQQQQQS